MRNRQMGRKKWNNMGMKAGGIYDEDEEEGLCSCCTWCCWTKIFIVFSLMMGGIMYMVFTYIIGKKVHNEPIQQSFDNDGDIVSGEEVKKYPLHPKCTQYSAMMEQCVHKLEGDCSKYRDIIKRCQEHFIGMEIRAKKKKATEEAIISANAANAQKETVTPAASATPEKNADKKIVPPAASAEQKKNAEKE